MSEYKSRVYTERPAYADYDSAAKFQALEGIIITRLTQHPNAICSYSGGSDSDILIDLIERTRKMFNAACGREVLKPVKYVFFNTGLEMKATKDHVKATAEKYGVEIEEFRPKINIVKSAREHGIPFVSKIMSQGLEGWQKKGIPLSIADEYAEAEDKAAKRKELKERYPKFAAVIQLVSRDRIFSLSSIQANICLTLSGYILRILKSVLNVAIIVKSNLHIVFKSPMR